MTAFRAALAFTFFISTFLPNSLTAHHLSLPSSQTNACETVILSPDPDEGEEGETAPEVRVGSPEELAEGANGCFQGARAVAILTNQPNLQTRRSAQQYGIYASQAGGIANTEGFSGPLWVSLGLRRSELDGAELDQGIATIGGDLYFAENTIFGLMLQSDYAFQDGPSETSFDATGVMAGAYGIYINGNLAFDARLLGGVSSTDISGNGVRVDDVQSTRWLAAMQVSNQLPFDNGQVLIPHLSVGWIQDKMDSYQLSVIPVPETTINYGQADLGGTWLVPISLGNADGNFIVGASGIFGFGESAGEEVPEGARGRLDLGVEFYRADAWSVSATLFSDGLGQENFESLGADLGVTLWF